MIRKTLFTSSMLISVTLLASCSPAETTSTPVPNMPNPAAVYCEQHGGKQEIVTTADGSQSGLCVFPDSSTCDEWAYFRSECKPGESVVTPGPLASPTLVSTVSMPTTIPATPSPPPTLKPAMLRVAYSGDGHIMLWTEGEGARQVAEAMNVEQVRISYDGQVIAYTSRNSHGFCEIWSVNADGTNHRRLVGEDYVQNILPAQSHESFNFAPASHTLYFATDQYDLHRVNADSGSLGLVIEAGQGGFFTFSPDGQWLTVYHPREMILAQSTGSAARVIYEWSPEVSVSTTGPEVIWAPDSAGFRLITLTDQEGDQNSMTVWYFPVNGNPIEQWSYTGPYGGTLSPDGRTVVYLNDRNEPIEVHVISEDGTDTIFGSYASQSYFNLHFLGWAPDSQHFLLNMSKDGRLQVPYLCAVGEQPVKLTDTDDAHAVVWIDAQHVLFASHGKTLHLQRVGAPSTLLDDNASSWFDYTFVNP
jgi:putative hemolysin